MIVWEVNPFPRILVSRSKLSYRNHAIDRTFAAKLLLYLERAGLAAPDRLRQQVVYTHTSRAIGLAASDASVTTAAATRASPVASYHVGL